MPLMIYGGKLLVVGGALAADPACCCEASSCTCCQSGTVPDTIPLLISGIGNGSCQGCGSVNGSYSLRYVSGCLWQAEPRLVQICGLSMSVSCSLEITCDGTDTIITVHFLLFWRAPELAIDFVKVVTGKPIDCTQDIQGLYAGNVIYSSGTCDGSSAACTI
jgi:hypothetical protein